MDTHPFPHATFRLTRAARRSGIEMTLGQAREIVEKSVPLFDGRHVTHEAILETGRIMYHPRNPFCAITVPQIDAARKVLRAIQAALPVVIVENSQFQVGDRIRWAGPRGVIYGTVDRVDEDLSVWGTFDDGGKFVRDKIKDITVVDR